MPSFRQADQSAKDLLREVMEAHHPGLMQVDARIGLLFAFGARDQNGMLKGPTLKVRGRAVRAVVKITSQQQRVSGMPDAVISVDGDEWENWPQVEQAAVLDGCLTGIVASTDTDDASRPKMVKREPDFEASGFFEVMERHQQASMEWQQVEHLQKQLVQRNLFPMG